MLMYTVVWYGIGRNAGVCKCRCMTKYCTVLACETDERCKHKPGEKRLFGETHLCTPLESSSSAEYNYNLHIYIEAFEVVYFLVESS